MRQRLLRRFAAAVVLLAGCATGQGDPSADGASATTHGDRQGHGRDHDDD